MIRNIEVIGEAANNLAKADSALTRRNPSLRLAEAYRMRKALSHGYYSVNLRSVWNTVEKDLPVLKAQMMDLFDAE